MPSLAPGRVLTAWFFSCFGENYLLCCFKRALWLVSVLEVSGKHEGKTLSNRTEHWKFCSHDLKVIQGNFACCYGM